MAQVENAILQSFWEAVDAAEGETAADVEGLVWQKSDGDWIALMVAPDTGQVLRVKLDYNPWSGEKLDTTPPHPALRATPDPVVQVVMEFLPQGPQGEEASEEWRGPLREFLHDNEELDSTEVQALLALVPGASLLMGGGAAALNRLTRIDGLASVEQTLQDMNDYLAEVFEQPPALTLAEAQETLAGLLDTDCECDNSHAQNGTVCQLCYARAVLLANRPVPEA